MNKPLKKILIIEDDSLYEIFWTHICERIEVDADFEWCANLASLEKDIRNGVKNLQDYDLIISDIFLSGKKSGLDFWLENEIDLRNKNLIISSVGSQSMDSFLGNRDFYPFYLLKPLKVRECVDLLNWIFNHQNQVRTIDV